MALTLQSDERAEPRSMQFAHFGVLNDGRQSKPSVFASLFLNVIVMFVLVVAGLANRRMIETRTMLSSITFQPVPKVEPVKPKYIPPPPKPPVIPEVVKLEVRIPQIVRVKPPDVPKPPEVKVDVPKPVIAPPAPAKVVAMAAPVAVNLTRPKAASVVNNDAHPTAVQLGSANNPVLHGPAVANVNLGRGLSGASGNGYGPTATNVNLGNGSAGGSLHGNGPVAVTGIPHGVPAGTGTALAANQVNLGQNAPPPMPKAAAAVAPLQRNEPKVIYKPKPEYTDEARRLHIEGTMTLRIRVLPNGSVMVLSVVNDLGHGLADSAKRAVLATKFEPATDAAGQPISWDGTVTVTFQLAG